MTAPANAPPYDLQYIGQVQGLRALALGLRLPGNRPSMPTKNDIDMKLSSTGPKLAQVLLT
ncbi:hypothetical protein GIR22_10175 [Pseudomonas sp. CCM 7891]|uniref:Uncharacterized protein n=1 Tax=Pseudomonas karstica TaxID=1055468 RepID=A0A7X2UYV7_9PSED|nr:hypothetical protein [Pseudomonas karstica]MTD19500.1 hypothetical protein [Pseudomonas karstica]